MSSHYKNIKFNGRYNPNFDPDDFSVTHRQIMSVAPEPLGGGHYYVNVIDYKTSMYLHWTNTSTSHKVRVTFTAAICMTRYRPIAFFSHCMISRASGCGPSRVAQIASMTSSELLPVGQVSIIPTRKSRSLSVSSKRSCPIKLVVRMGYRAPCRHIFNWCH